MCSYWSGNCNDIGDWGHYVCEMNRFLFLVLINHGMYVNIHLQWQVCVYNDKFVLVQFTLIAEGIDLYFAFTVPTSLCWYSLHLRKALTFTLLCWLVANTLFTSHYITVAACAHMVRVDAAITLASEQKHVVSLWWRICKINRCYWKCKL